MKSLNWNGFYRVARILGLVGGLSFLVSSLPLDMNKAYSRSYAGRNYSRSYSPDVPGKAVDFFRTETRVEDLKKALGSDAPGNPDHEIGLKIIAQSSQGFGSANERATLTGEESKCAKAQVKQFHAALKEKSERVSFLSRIPIDQIEIRVGTAWTTAANSSVQYVDYGIQITSDPILRLFAAAATHQIGTENYKRCVVSTSKQIGTYIDDLMESVDGLRAIRGLLQGGSKVGATTPSPAAPLASNTVGPKVAEPAPVPASVPAKAPGNPAWYGASHLN